MITVSLGRNLLFLFNFSVSALLNEAREEKGEDLTKGEIFNIAGPVYIPAVLLGVSTVACVLGANLFNKKTQASLASAYALLDSSYKEYKGKVTELFGAEGHDQIIEEMAKDRYISGGQQKELFYDAYSKRYFESTLPDVLRAQAEINKIMTTGWGASLNEFYELLGLKGIVEWRKCTGQHGSNSVTENW